eukprot:TRINITY_DN104713_c0_g1_i1.p1 TRINITY_DN104713_c0_g1~~TRINITY_DN104713_c0_g1_i1.p1  ORF type:complete len:363 (+),score=60.97 TRINITY_DN104713_c0_g1_i1:102-1091(+)
MPELPEVETSRRIIEKHCKGRTIVAVVTRECGGGPRNGKYDSKVMAESLKEARLVKALKGRKLLKARRRGKQLWLELDGKGPALLMHLGMTGAINIKGGEGVTYKRWKKDTQWPPRFTKLLLKFSGGKELAFSDPRRFGKIVLRDCPEEELPISALAADPVNDSLPLKDFASALAASKLAVKALLLNQERVVSGVGNWVADEVLYQAQVHPAKQSCDLSAAEVKAVHTALLSVCKKACAVSADHTRFPKSWLFHYRWGKGRSAAEMLEENDTSASKHINACLPDGKSIHFTEVGGRTTAFVPAIQRQGKSFRGAAMKKPASATKRLRTI